MKPPPGQGPWLGLDIGGTKLLATCVSSGLEVLGEARVPTGRDQGRDAVLQRCADLVAGLVREHRPVGLGVGFAGLVDAERGVTRSSIMVPGFEEFALGDWLANACGLPVRVDNDANTAALAELAARPRPGLHMVVLTVGTGIGGAIVIDGALYRGAGGFAGELGNTTLDWRGERCWCGNLGCANMLASGSALAAAAGLPAEEVARRAASGDANAQARLDHTTRALGALVANVVNTFNPHRVALAGGLATLAGFVAAVRAEAGRRAFAEAFAQVEIVAAAHGERASAVGAAVLAKEAAR